MGCTRLCSAFFFVTFVVAVAVDLITGLPAEGEERGRPQRTAEDPVAGARPCGRCRGDDRRNEPSQNARLGSDWCGDAGHARSTTAPRRGPHREGCHGERSAEACRLLQRIR